MSYNNKNAVWGNKHQQGGNQLGAMGNLNHPGIVPFQQQQQVFQNIGLNQQNLGLGLQQMAANQLSLASNPIFQQQLSAVSYPNPRGLNPNAFPNQGGAQSNPVTGKNFLFLHSFSFRTCFSLGAKQKVFTGTVTQIQENFGFIDDEVFFSRNMCLKGSNPMVGDRVFVEATFNPSMPFKWNATRVQVVQSTHSRDQRQVDNSNMNNNSSINNNNNFGRRNDMGNREFRDNRPKPSVGERRNRSRDRDDDEVERKRRREERLREREKEEKDRKSPARRRSRSPKARRRTRTIARYMVQIPKISLNL